MKNRYKEQMSKIFVDTEMKKRVINKVIETQENKNEKKFIFKGQAFYKYGGVVAACCAFVVTYAITTNYLELVNNNDRVLVENEYSIDDTKDKSKLEEYENSTEEKNNETRIIEDNLNNEEEKEDADNKSKRTANNEQVVDSNVDYSVKNEVVVNTEEIDNAQNQIDNAVYNDDKSGYMTQNYDESKYAENDIEDDNSKISTASYGDEKFKQRQYLSQCGVPDLSRSGLHVSYVNQVSQNEVEIMYSDDARNLWIKICSKEDEELKDSSILVYNSENSKQEIFKDNYEINRHILYRKNNKNYYIWSNVNMNDKFIKDIIKCI